MASEEIQGLLCRSLPPDRTIKLFGLIKSGKLKPVIGATFGLSQAVMAHRAMLARETTGKITLNPAE